MRISSANYIPVSPVGTFQNPADPRVVGLKQMATLTVLSYDCENLSAARLRTHAGREFPWLPEIVSHGDKQAVNLHVFAEPWTFRPLGKGDPLPDAPLPFNALLNGIGGDPSLTMLSPSGAGGSLFSDIDPGAPIPGLPEPEKLALAQHSQMVRYGMSHHHDFPYDCGPGVVQRPGTTSDAIAQTARAAAPLTQSKRAFAQLQNKEPKVLANPHVVVIYWGSPTIDSDLDGTLQQLLKLDFVKSALAEYGVSAPRYVKSVANPNGSKNKIEDAPQLQPAPEQSAIASGLNALILADQIPDPREDANLLYLIVAAPGAKSLTPGVTGGHNYFYLEVPGAGGQTAAVSVRYGWALQNEIRGSDLTALNNLTWTLSHELLEACTDPEPPNGYVFAGAEICDIAAGLHGNVDGIEVTGYFSAKDGVYKTPGVKPAVASLTGTAKA
jgi:hypothetical protein